MIWQTSDQQKLREGGQDVNYIGIDSGGTFTDVVLMDESGNVQSFKTQTTPRDPSIGVMEGVKLAAQSLGVEDGSLLRECAYFAHGTTVATNALLQRHGAKVGLITTKGFKDIILIQRATGPHIGVSEDIVTHYSKRTLPTPIVAPQLIKEVSERVDYKGAELVPLNEQETLKAVRELAEQGIEAIAVCFLWSFRNPKHEQRVKQIIAEELPGIHVSISSELVPVIREYERTVTTVFNAFLNPVVGSYARNMEARLKDKGLGGLLSFMTSAGGVSLPQEAKDRGIALVNSGPIGGVLASVYLGQLLGYNNILATDMGGTSFDISLIVDGQAKLTLREPIDRYLFHALMVEVNSIGAGGGSIARVENGLLKVGPQSAAAIPGRYAMAKGERNRRYPTLIWCWVSPTRATFWAVE